jgi:hypothetical protein
MKFLNLWNRIGKQPIKDTKKLDVVVETEDGRYIVTKINYLNGKLYSLQAERITCNNCKNSPQNNNGYCPPHTCDICTSLDEEEEFGMWNFKQNK